MLLTTLVLAAGIANAADADRIIEKSNKAMYYAGEDGRSDVKMTITDKGGKKRTREFTILRKNFENMDQKFYVYFHAPADVRKMAYLVWKNAESADDRWLWLPALNLVKRIAPGDKRTSFVGSDFLYEDVSGRAPDADTHELIKETESRYIVRNVPKKPGEVEFSEYTVEIDKKTYIPMKAEYLDKKGDLYRRIEALEIKKIEGFPTVIRSRATDLERESHTVNEFSDIEYNIGLNERLFTERFLRRPPREVQR
jgi:hypothetical protein